jgi:prolyl oligopeptidase
MTYPETKRVDVVEEHFGRRIVDPYRSLEKDARSDHEVTDWVAAQQGVPIVTKPFDRYDLKRALRAIL